MTVAQMLYLIFEAFFLTVGFGCVGLVAAGFLRLMTLVLRPTANSPKQTPIPKEGFRQDSRADRRG